MNKGQFYITTTLPYVNAVPHLGHALEFIRADIIARVKEIEGYEVFFNTGTDEHGIKVFRKAQELHLDTQKYVDGAADKFKEIIPLLGMKDNIHFIRTTDKYHMNAAQEFWKAVDKNGYIYKKNYSVKYCVGCEMEKTDSELVDGKCPLHPLQELEIINEENYFFKFSAFQEKLLKLYSENSNFVIPPSRQNEIRSFVERGLEDFSISRLKTKMPWGVPVPGDENQVMYVWFDALVNYISAVGWPHDMKSFDKWWVKTGGVIQYCGKDNLRQQSAMWQAMLLAAGIPNSKQIIINGFVTGEGGIKMSKSLGNVVDPVEIVRDYGTDALRYYIAKEVHSFEDSPFTLERFKESYNAGLANGIGNLTSRIMKMATTNNVGFDFDIEKTITSSEEVGDITKRYKHGFEVYDIQKSSQAIWDLIANTDKIIQEREPFKKIKVDKAGAEKDIKELVARLHIIGSMLLPIIPQTAKSIITLVEQGKMPESPLFMRK